MKRIVNSLPKAPVTDITLNCLKNLNVQPEVKKLPEQNEGETVWLLE